MLYTPLDAAEGPLVVAGGGCQEAPGALERGPVALPTGWPPLEPRGRRGGRLGGSSDRIHRPNLAVNTVARVCEYGCE